MNKKVRKNKIAFWFLAAGFAVYFLNTNITYAQSPNYNQLLGQLNPITTAVPFLLIAPDSRASAMGDCGVSTTPDATSLHWNPSKAVFLEKQTGVAISYIPWLRALVPDINLSYLSGYYKTKKGTVMGSLRYFSLGDITFTDIVGNTIGQFRPNEFAIDAGYGTKLGEHFAGGGALRFIYSNLTGGIPVSGATTHAGTSVAADISGYYQSSEKEIGGKKSIFRAGINISNIGAKISYTDLGIKNFIPINLRLGPSLTMKLDDYNDITFLIEANKLLVPTPPVYKTIDSAGKVVYAKDAQGNYIIAAGQDPNRSVVSGILGSFSDAPGGFREELREINLAGGFEYGYAKQFFFRSGYFYEHPTKGGRQYLTLGFGVKYTVFTLDFSYLVPTNPNITYHPLKNTIRFTLMFDFNAFKDQNSGEGEKK